ncbi:uncharacterized protein LOC112555465 [Pomacea canaliculata]|uniref:uncharacterized protein LOC112555465 n=1 Tax=Pomacea canaliculata TaxID=400727 RepID=UPI000D730AD2|nr:uncharacterized protein LOC112555465 [Pomacea canaliculata]
MDNLDYCLAFHEKMPEMQKHGHIKFFSFGKIVINMLGSFKVKETNIELDDKREVNHEVTVLGLDKGHVTIREKFKLNKDHRNNNNGGEESFVVDLRSPVHVVRRGNFSIREEWLPIPVQKPPMMVLLKPDGKFNQNYICASAKGFPEMAPLRSGGTEEAVFRKKDYIIEKYYASTFTNITLNKRLSVSTNLEVMFDTDFGDPQKSTDPSLFLVPNSGSTQIRPASAPEKYLSHQGNRVIITDEVSSFSIVPTKEMTNVTNNAGLPLGNNSSGLRLDTVSSPSDVDIDYYITRNGGWPRNRVVEAVSLRHSTLTRSWSQ